MKIHWRIVNKLMNKIPILLSLLFIFTLFICEYLIYIIVQFQVILFTKSYHILVISSSYVVIVILSCILTCVLIFNSSATGHSSTQETKAYEYYFWPIHTC